MATTRSPRADQGAAERLPRPFKRPQHTFSSRAVSVLRDMVLSGRLRPGERLNEVELASALGISRGPLREAIQRLRSEGLLTAVSGRGAYVRTFTPDSLRELYEVRIALETHAVKLVARKPDPQGMRRLRQLLADTDQALAESGPYPHTLDFHHRIVLMTGNKALLDMVTEVHRQIHLARSRSGYVPARAREALQEHKEVLRCVVHGDGEAAAAVLERHLRASLQSALDLFDSDTALPA